MPRTIFSGHATGGQLHKFQARCICMLMALASGLASAAVSQTPLFVVQPPNPNIMYTLDNSGSMVWGSVTGTDATAEFNSAKTLRAYYASAYNGIYYNPATTYTPGVLYDGTKMATSVASARIDPYPTAGGTTSTLNVAAQCFIKPGVAITLPLYDPSSFSAYFKPSGRGATPNCNPADNTYTQAIAQYAFYYTWVGSGAPDGSSGQDTATNYTRTDIISSVATYPKASTRTDCGTGTTCTYAQEIQNFANWFSYARTRILMTKTALGLAFSGIDPVVSPVNPPKFRVGFNTINSIGSDGSVGYNNTDVTDGPDWLTIRDFNSTQKQSFYAKLYAISPNQGTPLRTQMNRIGQLYQGTLSGFDYTNNDPYRNTATDSTLVSCRASYHIMSTDGFWNDSSGDTNFPASSVGTYLADITNYYYTNDLRTTLTNNVKPTNTTDTATWQHMTTFTIGLGANGSLTYTPNSVPTSWPTPVANTNTTIDDLWHAAVNGRGSYFSARNPTDLESGLTSVLNNISKQPGAASAVSVSLGKVSSSSLIYVPGFESGTWIGHLKAYSLNADGTTGAQAWGGKDAADLLPVPASRNIVTWNPSATTPAAVAFTWANLTTAQQTALSASTVLDYLRGDGSNEQTAGGAGPGVYRYRANKLGDIVNSSPLYVQSSDFGYYFSSFAGGGATYNTFVSGKSSRTPMLYVGANDGMLHAFNASTGVETFAYVPNAIYSKLKTLSSPSNSHQYYVDGPLSEGDAYFGTGSAAAWKTYVVGSTGAGAPSVFALDVTSPGSLGTASVKWEKSSADTGFANLGLVLGQSTIVRLTTGQWGVVFGNGYDSATGVASLFVVNLADGSVIKEFALGGTANGLSAPALVFNDNRELVGAYAGDLAGNLWRFNLSDTSAANWTSSTLFTAKDAASPAVVQPIVQKPVVAAHPLGGYLVTIGTGKYLAATDKAVTQVQSLYGIWDSSTSTTTAAKVTGRSALQVQTLTDQLDANGVLLGRTLTNTPVDWSAKFGWYVDFPASGERVVGDLQILDNIVLLTTTLAPVGDICVSGGVSQTLASDYLTGGASPNTKIYKNGILAVSVNGTLLSSVTMKATNTNTSSASLGNGDWAQKGNPLDGGTPDELKIHTGYGAVRTWHQLPIKPN
jgi:type IV pilus assembly protein PilY1